MDNPAVDGISLRQDWADLEPSEGVFSWTFLDSEVARAAAAGKQVLLRINTQAHKPAWVNDAVVEAGGSFFTFSDSGIETTIPVFWDPTFLAKKKAMIAAVGAHFTKNPAITIVWASFANANSEDWAVPHTTADITQWSALGYTTEKMLDAGMQIIDATMAAFPNQFVTLAVGGSGHAGASGNLDPDASYVARNEVLEARATWPGRLIVQKNNVATFNPQAPATDTLGQILWDSRPDVGGQMLDASFDDNTYRNNAGVTASPNQILRDSINRGFSYGMKFIEIYQLDVLNLPSEITYAHNLLRGFAPPPPDALPIGAPKPPGSVKAVTETP
ncbi:MAG: beta-galactosidase [Chthoniobacterales bacterium]